MKENTDLTQINQKDIIREISYLTGFLQKDVEKVLQAEAFVITEAISQGHEVKNHKLYKAELQEREGGKRYDGINKTYYNHPSKEVLKIRPMSYLKLAEKIRNNEELSEDEKKAWEQR